MPPFVNLPKVSRERQGERERGREREKQQQNIAEQDKHRELKAPGKVAMSMLNKRTKPNQTEPNREPNPVQSHLHHPPSSTCAIAMGMLLFTAFKLVGREIKKEPQAAGAGVAAAAGGVTAVPVGGQAGCPSVLSICSFLPNRLFVGWLSYVLLCVPLCKILYHTAGRCPLVPRLSNGTMSCTVRALCLRYLWLPTPNPVQNG